MGPKAQDKLAATTRFDPKDKARKTSADKAKEDGGESDPVPKRTRAALAKLQNVPVDPPPMKPPPKTTRTQPRVTRSSSKETTAPAASSDEGQNANGGVPTNPGAEIDPSLSTIPEMAGRTPPPPENEDLSSRNADLLSTPILRRTDLGLVPIHLVLQHVSDPTFCESYTGQATIYEKGDTFIGNIPALLSGCAPDFSPLKNKKGYLYVDFDSPDSQDNEPERTRIGRFQEVLAGTASSVSTPAFCELPLTKKKFGTGVVYEAKLYSDDITMKESVPAPVDRNPFIVSNPTPISQHTEAIPAAPSKLWSEYNGSRESAEFLEWLSNQLDGPKESWGKCDYVEQAWKRELGRREVIARADKKFGRANPKTIKDGPFESKTFNQKALIDVCLFKHTIFQKSKLFFETAEKYTKFKEFLDSYDAAEGVFDESHRYCGMGVGEFWGKVEAYDHKHSHEVQSSSESDQPRVKKAKKSVRVEKEKKDKVNYKVTKRSRDQNLGITSKKHTRAGPSTNRDPTSSDMDDDE